LSELATLGTAGESGRTKNPKKKVAHLLADVPVGAGLERIWGVWGDSLNGITALIRSWERIRWIHVRHEEVAAFAAGAEAHLTGKFAACARSSGPGSPQRLMSLPKISAADCATGS
jgi:thiamine pyrophosphate-dependent acetolactate synthase large subunit-like protein